MRETNIIGIYFGGTGNTKYCIDKFVNNVDINKCIKCKKCISLYPMNNSKAMYNKIKTNSPCVADV